MKKKYYLTDDGLIWRINEHIKRINVGRGERFELKTVKDTAKCLTTDGGGRIGSNFLISPNRCKTTGAILGYRRSDHFNTITTSQTCSTAQWLKYAGRIRRLTPTECFRLMGMKDNEIKKLVNSGISDTQLYKLAGNSIVVDVLAAIFGQLFNKTKAKAPSSTLGQLAKIRQILEGKHTKPTKKRVRL